MPRAFITGITGQDGRHLAEFLHGKGYDVYGMVKGQNNPRAQAVTDEMPFVELVPGDLADLPSLVAALELSQIPDGTTGPGGIHIADVKTEMFAAASKKTATENNSAALRKAGLVA